MGTWGRDMSPIEHEQPYYFNYGGQQCVIALEVRYGPNLLVQGKRGMRTRPQ